MDAVLKYSFEHGLNTAFETYGIKEAIAPGLFASVGQKATQIGKDLATNLVGSPRQALNEWNAGKLFQPEGLLHHSKTLWSPMPAPRAPLPSTATGYQKFRHQAGDIFGKGSTWANRAFTVGLPTYEAYKALKGDGDPNEGRMTNALSAMGRGLGWAYGQPLVGMLGAPYASMLGGAAGKGIGHLLGSKPTQMPQNIEVPYQQSPYEQGYGV